MPDRFRFDPLREEDLPLLRDWLCRPRVAQWWGGAESIDTLRADDIVGTDVAGATRAYITVGHTLFFEGRALYLEEHQNVDIIDRFPGFLGYAP